ncbi:MAG: family 20 glycosylhydrolase [Bacteroides sp.]|nr:family 20 glycosylhydrolase [Bacteroides sp.]MCM1380072.1 family 20 glycosylhydrolase [Bacteroides sp.]MCM1446409.1 family 20 glycosylhydrolase [Prevotella sp.]
MKKLLLSALVAAMASMSIHAEAFVNLTPVPKQMTVASGELTLPQTIAISGYETPEADKFAAAFTSATGISVAKGNNGLINLTKDSAIAAEGYNLDITANGITIAASTDAGFFYAFQTLKKLAGANVAIGVYAPGEYSLPLVSIEDEPRYQWRGLEIDVARHFFDVDEIKKMIDIMAVYKMNRLHWHLTDDQGWRFEMPNYPKLTQDVAAPKNQYWWDFDNHKSFLTNKQYGPYFYSVEEMKEVVAYAKERHIEVCPEVDMPGHMQCAIAAYPEFSTTPDGDHPVRYWPGVSSDILDISNPAVMQFLRDVMDQLVEIFPYEYIHIGGDECPTTAWGNSTACQNFKKEHGLTSDRAIQNWMTKELADYVKKDNRKLICWNEVITTAGANTKLAQDADILIYAWLSADATVKQAASLGLRSVWCSTNHYYIDYPQWNGPDEPHSMGYALNLELVYNTKPYSDPAKPDLYYGVNCNLWTEFISENKHLEYNALPRMIAVAETGWSPESKKDFNDFKKRFNADTELLDLGNYTYGRHYVDNQADRFQPEAGKYYRLITQASADANRKDRCIELVHDGCDLLTSKSATVSKLWTNTQADKGSDHYDWQYWTFETDPAGSGKYAMVNRKVPAGSVNPNMTGSSVNARWDYDNETKHYNFLIGEQYSKADLGGIVTIRSDKGATWYLNCAQAAQNQTVNNWNNPLDGNGGMWLFHLEDYEPQVEPEGVPFEPLISGVYGFINSIGYGPLSVTDNALTTEADPRFGAFGWEVTAGTYDSQTNTQILTLRNAATGLYIGELSNEAVSTIEFTDGWGVFAGNAGYVVNMTAEVNNAAAISLTKLESGNWSLSIDGKQLFAFGAESSQFPGAVNARANAPEMQGAGWEIHPVTKAIRATAKEGENLVGTYYYYDFSEAAVQPALACPYPLYEISGQEYGEVTDGHTNVAVSLRKIKREVFYKLTDTNGVLWETAADTIDVNIAFTPVAPTRSYLTFKEAGAVLGDTAVMVYTTEATPGIGKLGQEVATLEAGDVYAIEDIHATRHAFRGEVGGKVMGSRTAEGRSPAYLWTLEASGSNYYVKNVASGKYVQELVLSTSTLTGKNPHAFSFSYADDVWKIKSSGNGYCWDGDDVPSMVGWYDPGHQHKIYELKSAQPFYRLTISEELSDGTVLSEKETWVKAGSSYMFAPASHPGMELVGVTGNDAMDAIYANKNIVVTYAMPQDGITIVNGSALNTQSAIFDLQGRRVINPSTGIYIVDGIKTLIR